MESNELRIGNWVLNSGKSPVKVTAQKIADIDSGYILNYPISLTEEILLQCPQIEKRNIKTGVIERWIYEFDIDVFDELDGMFIEKHGNKWVLGMFFDEACNHIKYFAHGNFNYLHEFQNLVYQLSKTELEINL